MGDGDYKSKDSTNSIKVLKEKGKLQRKTQTTQTTKYTHTNEIVHAIKIHITQNKSPSLQWGY